MKKQKIELIILIAVAVVCATGMIWIRIATVKDTYRYVQQEKRLLTLQQKIQFARVQWLKLTSPRRLESLSHSLGLKPAGIDQVLQYKSVQSVAKESE